MIRADDRLRTPRTTYRGRGVLLAAALALATASLPSSAQQPAEPQTADEVAGAPDADEAAPEAQKAAPAPTAFGNIEVITIRGSHRDDLLQDTAVSVTSFNTKELEDLRIQNISDLAEYTPNLDINTRSAASNPTLFIRGIGLKDYNANASGAVAVYQDGININAPAIQLFQLFDVASVEVLRGPQGAGSGRNATAGAIKVNSAQPDGTFGATGSFTYGNYNTIQAEGALNLPLIEGTLSSRFAFTANFRDGTTKNQCANWNPAAHLNYTNTDSSGNVVPVPFNAITQGTITADYQALDASNNQVRVWNRQGTAQVSRYIYQTGLTGDPNNPSNKDEPLAMASKRYGVQLLQIGNVYKPPDTSKPPGEQYPADAQWVGVQDNKFAVVRGQVNGVDGVCILAPPGDVVTPLGASAGFGTAGEFDRQNVPNLEDFQGLKDRVNNVDDWAGRGILRFQPRDDMDWSLNAHGGRNRSDSRHLQMVGAAVVVAGEKETCVFCESSNFSAQFSERDAAEQTGFEGLREVDGLLVPAGVNGVPGGETGDDPFSGWYNQDGTEFLDAWGTSLRGTWDLGSVVLSSVGGYEWYDRFIEDEGDASPGIVFPAEWEDSAHQVSEELRAEYEGERFRLYLGGLFLTENLKAHNLFPATQNFRIEQSFDQKLWHVGPYVGGRYELSEELSVESGVRYNVEHKEFTLASSAVGNQFGTSVPQIDEREESDTWTAVTGEFILGYTPYWGRLDELQNDNLNFYAKYARGMKPGHFNAGLTIQTNGIAQPNLSPVEPEFIHSAEVGVKSGWLDGRLTLNVTGFRYWYKDLQVFDIVNEVGALPTQQLLNSDARVWGTEVELQARPLPGLSIQAGFGFLAGHFVGFSVEKAVAQPRGQGTLTTFDYDGNPLISAPRYSVSAIVDYEIPLGRIGSLIPGYDVSWRSKVYLDPQQLGLISQPAYWLHNARLTYRTPDARIEVAGWVENFTNQYYRDDVFDLTRQYREVLEVWGDPRTYGLTVTYTW